MLAEQCPLVGVVSEDLHRGSQLIAGGVGARAQQGGSDHEQFGVGEAIAVVLGADQIRNQIVGEGLAASGDHGFEVGVEVIPRRHDGGPGK